MSLYAPVWFSIAFFITISLIALYYSRRLGRDGFDGWGRWLRIIAFAYIVIAHFGLLVALSPITDPNSPCEYVINSTSLVGGITTYSYTDTCAYKEYFALEAYYVFYAYLMLLGVILIFLFLLIMLYKAIVKW